VRIGGVGIGKLSIGFKSKATPAVGISFVTVTVVMELAWGAVCAFRSKMRDGGVLKVAVLGV